MYSLSDIGSYASIVSLFGLMPILYSAWHVIILRWRRRFANWLVKQTKYDNWVIVIPRYDNNMSRIEDVIACDVLMAKFINLGIKVQLIDDEQPIPKNTNIILVCGPKANRQSKILSTNIRLPFEIDSNGAESVIHDFDEEQYYKSPIDSIRKNSDYAIMGKITYSKIPYYLIWGVHGVGTIGAARAFSDDAFLHDLWKLTSGNDFLGIVSTQYSDFYHMWPATWFIKPRSLNKNL